MKKAGGFSLVELLVVLALVGILAGMLGSSLQGIFQASGVSEAVSQLDTDLSLARQAAGVKNREYEVRFLKFPDSDAVRPEPAYRGYQILIRDPSLDPSSDEYTTPGTDEFDPPAIAIHAVREFQGTVVFLEDDERSNLLTDSTRVPPVESIEIGDNVEASYTYFRFKPDGSTDLGKDTRWYVTIVNEEAASRGNLSNIATLEVDPSTGVMTWYRP